MIDADAVIETNGDPLAPFPCDHPVQLGIIMGNAGFPKPKHYNKKVEKQVFQFSAGPKTT